MTRFLGYIAASLDGRIADREGGVGWLDEFGAAGEAGDYAGFYAGVDALVMGRRTHDQVRCFGEWPYAGRACYVVTSRPMPRREGDVAAVPPDFPALKARIGAAGHRNVWVVGGAQTLGEALRAGMLDTLRIFVMPVALGAGPPLLAAGAAGTGTPPRRRAVLEACRSHPPGIVELAYSFAEHTP